MHKRLVLLGAVILALVCAASATPVTYTVSVDTSSITGTAGSLDFNFNPGPLVTQSANVQILGFSSNGTLGTATTVGNVAGTLPGTLNFDNGTVFNDYFETFTFGSALSFDVSLYGPALNAPDGTSTSGSTFAFSLFSDPGGTVPVLTSDTVNGLGYVVNVNLDGSTTVINNLGAVPELGSGILSLTGIALAVAIAAVKKRAGRGPWRELLRI
jgi:hypothetical protein